jgi:aminotransferase
VKAAGRLKSIKPSGIRRFFALAGGMGGCINLGVGEPDFHPPRQALQAGWDAALEGKTQYTPTNGIFELRAELAERVRLDHGLNYDPNCEILVTGGATEAIFIALMGLLDPGDEVLITNPGFVAYEPSAYLAGGSAARVPLLEENDFKPTIDDVTSLITKRSRVIILNYPNNPTGAVLSHDEIGALARVAVERDMIVISDEVYERVVYDGARHCCLASFPDMRERTLVVNSFSKTYAMTGLRVGYVCGPNELISSLWLVHQYAVACVNSLAQYTALAALRGSQDFVRNMVSEFDKRRRLMFKKLNEIEGFRCLLPKGAFYMFPNIKEFGLTSEQFSEFLAKEAQVITVPGTAFGSCGEGYIRISYAAAYDQLEEALDRIEKAVKKIETPK